MRWIYALAAAAFVAFMGWHALGGRLAGYAGQLASDAALQVTVADLYLGLAIFGAFVYGVERRLTPALLWLAAALPIGNVVPALYVVLRWRKITGKA